MFRQTSGGKYVAHTHGLELRADPDGAGGITPVDGDVDLRSADGVQVRGKIKRWMIDDAGGLSFEMEGSGRVGDATALLKSLEELGWARGHLRLRAPPPGFFPFGANALIIGGGRCGKTTLAFDLAQKHGGPSLVMHGGRGVAGPVAVCGAPVCMADPTKLAGVDRRAIIHDEVDTVDGYLADERTVQSFRYPHHTNILITHKPGQIPARIRAHCDLVVLFKIKDEGLRKTIYEQFFSCMPRVAFEQAMERYTANYGAIVLCNHLAATSTDWREFVFHIKAGTCASRAKDE